MASFYSERGDTLEEAETGLVTATAEQTYEVKLDNYSKMDSRRYVSIGDGNVYLVKHDPLDEYDAVLSGMISHDAWIMKTPIRFRSNCTDTMGAIVLQWWMARAYPLWNAVPWLI